MTAGSGGVGKALAQQPVAHQSIFAGRLDSIEWVRVVAACGVVWFHVPGGPYKEFGYAGLVSFILISVIFQSAGAEKDSAGVYFRKKVDRILPPWLFWFVIYGLFNLAKGHEVFPFSEGLAAGALTGTWVGLWYMPFILLASIPVLFMVRAAGERSPWVLSVAFLLAGIAILFLCSQPQGIWKNQEPWAQWRHAAAAIPIGLAIFYAIKEEVSRRFAVLATVLLVSEAACFSLMGSNRGLAISYGVAILVVCAGFAIPIHPSPLARHLGALCLGVYMVHAAAITVLKRAPGFENRPWLLCAGVIVASFAGVFLARRNRLLTKVL